MNTLLIDTLKQIKEGKLIQESPVCFLYNNLEYEFAIDDEEQETYVASGLVFYKKGMTYDEVVTCMTAYIALDGYRWSPVFEYSLSRNEEDNTFNLTLYVEMVFHLSDSVQCKPDYLESFVLKALEKTIIFYFEMLDGVKRLLLGDGSVIKLSYV